MKYHNLLYRFVFGMGVAMLLSGCVQTEHFDINGQLKISPDTKSIAIVETTDADGQCLYDAGYYLDTPVVIAMTDSQGFAQGDTPVSVYVDYSENTFSGPPVLSLYADQNGNGVIDDPDELVSGFDQDIFTARTGRYNAELFLLLRINLSCAFRGQLTAVSGPMTASLAVELSSGDITVTDNSTEPDDADSLRSNYQSLSIDTEKDHRLGVVLPAVTIGQ